MSSLTRILAPLAALVATLFPLAAGEFSALARLDPTRSAVVDDGEGVALTLALSQPVPWRVFTLADPPRLVMDFREVDWRGASPVSILAASRVSGLRTGAIRPGWSRLVLDLVQPLAVSTAAMETGAADGSAMVGVRLEATSDAAFRAGAGEPETAGWGGLSPLPATAAPIADDRRLTIVLDPGHGGIDPGAEGEGVSEADLMLAFARNLEEALMRSGDFNVVLTRGDDRFVPLDTRITIARAARADLFLSLHADAVAEGRATGATVYTLSETASDEASAALAERHDRADLLAGVDLRDQDDTVAGVLMDLARLDTEPRSAALADAIVAGLGNSVGGLHKRPRLSAGFSVLRAPDIPSVLLELGYISSASDRDRLASAEWRAKAAAAVAGAIQAWLAADAARAVLVRR